LFFCAKQVADSLEIKKGLNFF